MRLFLIIAWYISTVHMYTTYTKWWLSLNGLAHRRQIIFFLGNKYQDTTIFLVRMQQSPSFYTVNIGQFLLQSKKTHWKWEQSWCSKNITVAIKNTACLEHSERLLAIYGCLHREMHINIMLLNIDEKHPEHHTHVRKKWKSMN